MKINTGEYAYLFAELEAIGFEISDCPEASEIPVIIPADGGYIDGPQLGGQTYWSRDQKVVAWMSPGENFPDAITMAIREVTWAGRRRWEPFPQPYFDGKCWVIDPTLWASTFGSGLRVLDDPRLALCDREVAGYADVTA